MPEQVPDLARVIVMDAQRSPEDMFQKGEGHG